MAKARTTRSPVTKATTDLHKTAGGFETLFKAATTYEELLHSSSPYLVYLHNTVCTNTLQASMTTIYLTRKRPKNTLSVKHETQPCYAGGSVVNREPFATASIGGQNCDGMCESPIGQHQTNQRKNVSLQSEKNRSHYCGAYTHSCVTPG